MVVDSTPVLLPERPTQVNERSEITDRSMIKREMARARDVGLLSEIAFDSKSNCFRKNKSKQKSEIRKCVVTITTNRKRKKPHKYARANNIIAIEIN